MTQKKANKIQKSMVALLAAMACLAGSYTVQAETAVGANGASSALGTKAYGVNATAVNHGSASGVRFANGAMGNGLSLVEKAVLQEQEEQRKGLSTRKPVAMTQGEDSLAVGANGLASGNVNANGQGAALAADEIPDGSTRVSLNLQADAQVTDDDDAYSDAPVEKALSYTVTGVASVFGDGISTSAVVLKYPKALKAKDITPDVYSVAGKNISYAWVMDHEPSMADLEALAHAEDTVAEDPKVGYAAVQAMNTLEHDGPYVVLLFEHTNSQSSAPLQKKAGGPEGNNGASGKDAPRISSRQTPDLNVTVKQEAAVVGVDGTVYEPADVGTVTASVADPEVKAFRQAVYTDPKTGESLPYNIYLPKNYNPSQKYPLVFFVADASANTNDVTTPLYQGNGATIWASPEEQAKHPAIVVAPQYTTDLVNRLGMLTTDENVWTPGLELVDNFLQDIIKTYPIDKKRIYGTGQSQGGMTNIAIASKHPNLFAAQYLVACQWNVDTMKAMKNSKLWMLVSEGDEKAYPGLSSAVNEWKALGTKVAESAMWDSTSTEEEFNNLVQADLAQKAPMQFSVFKGGNHMYTWSVAYNIEGIRDWMFAQHK